MRQSLTRLGPAAVAIPGIAAALVLGGCKDGQGSAAVRSSDGTTAPTGSAAPTTPAPGRPASSAKTRLTVTIRASEKSAPKTWTLTCDPLGGNLPRAKEACAALARAAAAGRDPFAPTPKDQMCTMIYGGPEIATVTGTWNGRKIDATFNRKNGCELKRWNDLGLLFGPVPPVR